jgi:hypothetical protein
MPESLQPVEEKRGVEMLRRIQAKLCLNVQPTVREAGLSAGEARWMANEGLVSLGDTLAWNQAKQDTTAFEDRYVIFELSDKAKGCLIDADASLSALPPMQTVTPPPNIEMSHVRPMQDTPNTHMPFYQRAWFQITALIPGSGVKIGAFCENCLNFGFPSGIYCSSR